MCWRYKLASGTAITKTPVMMHIRGVSDKYGIEFYCVTGNILNRKFGTTIWRGLSRCLECEGGKGKPQQRKDLFHTKSVCWLKDKQSFKLRVDSVVFDFVA